MQVGLGGEKLGSAPESVTAAFAAEWYPPAVSHAASPQDLTPVFAGKKLLKQVNLQAKRARKGKVIPLYQGTMRKGETVAWCREDGEPVKVRITELLITEALDRVPAEFARAGDLVAIAGIAEVARVAYPDPTQFDRKSEYHDPKATDDAPIWMQVDIRGVQALAEPIALDRLRKVPELDGMELLRRGSRLSVQPVREHEWHAIMELAGSTRAGAAPGATAAASTRPTPRRSR